MAAMSIKSWIENQKSAKRRLITSDPKARYSYAKLIQHANLQAQWTTAFRSIFPNSRSKNYSVTHVGYGTMTVHVEDSASATRLRFEAPEILKKLNVLQDFVDVKSLNIRITPSTKLTENNPQNIRQLPRRDILTDLASDIADDELRKSLLKLAAHGNQPSTSDLIKL